MNNRDERIKFYGAKRMNHHLRSNFLCDIVLCVRTCTNFSEERDLTSRLFSSKGLLFSSFFLSPWAEGCLSFSSFSLLGSKKQQQKKFLSEVGSLFYFVEMDGFFLFPSFLFMFTVVRYSSYELKQVRRRRRRRRRPRARTHDT